MLTAIPKAVKVAPRPTTIEAMKHRASKKMIMTATATLTNATVLPIALTLKGAIRQIYMSMMRTPMMPRTAFAAIPILLPIQVRY